MCEGLTKLKEIKVLTTVLNIRKSIQGSEGPEGRLHAKVEHNKIEVE